MAAREAEGRGARAGLSEWQRPTQSEWLRRSCGSATGRATATSVVAEVVRRSQPHTRAAEIIEFLDVARARGWIDET